MDLSAPTPAFLAGFASQCVRSERLVLYAPSTIHMLESFAQHRLAVVDIACKDARSGCYSGDERARQSVELKFGDFVDFYQAAHGGRAHWLQDVDDLEFYLCQCPIAVYRPDATCIEPVLPWIMDDFTIPESLSSSSQSLSQVNLWMAVRASRTSLHYDAYRNVLVVLYGRKTVTLYPPSESGKLYPFPVHSKSANHSQVDVSNPDLSRYPRFADAKSHMQIVLDAGDALVIPEGWWHQVDSDAFTIAVNFWFDGLQKQLTQEPSMTPYYARMLLQDLLKRESERYLEGLRTNATAKEQELEDRKPQRAADLVQRVVEASHQDEKEQILIASERNSQEFERMQRTLVTLYASDWCSLLENASDDFVALLTASWERVAARDEANGSEQSDQPLTSVMFSTFPDGGEQIRSELLAKKEAFDKKLCARVVRDAFGLDVRYNGPSARVASK